MKEIASQLEQQARYDQWATLRICEAALQAEEVPERFTVLLSHVLAAQEIWLDRMEGKTASGDVWPIYSSETWKDRVNANAHRLTAFITSCNDFDRAVDYTNTQGKAFRNRVNQILSHLFMHAQYHRGQMMQQLRPFVEKATSLDMIAYFRENVSL